MSAAVWGLHGVLSGLSYALHAVSTGLGGSATITRAANNRKTRKVTRWQISIPYRCSLSTGNNKIYPGRTHNIARGQVPVGRGSDTSPPIIHRLSTDAFVYALTFLIAGL